MAQTVRVRLPASTTNMGPGFDTLGVALSLHNYVEGEVDGEGIDVEATGRDVEEFADAVRAMVMRTIESVWRDRGPLPGLRFRLHNAVPIARGLGSSACLRLGVAFVVNRVCELGLSDDEIIAAELDAFKAAGMENGIAFDEFVMIPYQKFLSGGSKFVLTAKPSEPISLSQIDLYKPADVPALLNLTAETL